MPDIPGDEVETRLKRLAEVTGLMNGMLIKAAGTHWYGDESISVHPLALVRLKSCLDRLMEWQLSGAFETAQMALALLVRIIQL